MGFRLEQRAVDSHDRLFDSPFSSCPATTKPIHPRSYTHKAPTYKRAFLYSLRNTHTRIWRVCKIDRLELYTAALGDMPRISMWVYATATYRYVQRGAMCELFEPAPSSLSLSFSRILICTSTQLFLRHNTSLSSFGKRGELEISNGSRTNPVSLNAYVCCSTESGMNRVRLQVPF